MSNIICVTHRRLCKEDFLVRLKRIVSARPQAIILREKDLKQAEYRALAESVLPFCQSAHVPLILNGWPELAAKMGCAVQLSFQIAMTQAEKTTVPYSVSVHRAEEAAALQKSNANFLIAGHIWDTACKAGTPGRGIEFLRNIVKSADGKPVYAIGGVTPMRMQQVYAAGAAGACIMSALMTCEDPIAYLNKYA